MIKIECGLLLHVLRSFFLQLSVQKLLMQCRFIFILILNDLRVKSTLKVFGFDTAGVRFIKGEEAALFGFSVKASILCVIKIRC